MISAGGFYWVLKDNYYPGWKPRIDKNKVRERPILCIEKNKIYLNTTIAAIDNNVSTSAINAVLKRKHPTCKNCHWCYADEYNDDYIIREDERGWNKRKIVRVDDKKIYPSISSAAKEVGVSPSTILDCLTNRTNTAAGFEWCYLESIDNYQRKRNKHFRRVECVETGKTYDKIKDAAEDSGASASKINAVCRGSRKTAGGYHWKYVD